MSHYLHCHYPPPPHPAAPAAALYGEYRPSRSFLSRARVRVAPHVGGGRERIEAILGTIFLPQVRQDYSTEAYGTRSKC